MFPFLKYVSFPCNKKRSASTFVSDEQFHDYWLPFWFNYSYYFLAKLLIDRHLVMSMVALESTRKKMCLLPKHGLRR